MAKVAIISPHLDDAVLSCFLYMQRLMQTGHEVVVINIFSSCQNGGIVAPFIKPYIAMAGCNTAEDYELTRKTEDKNALRLLNIQPIDLDFIDAAFRGYDGIAEVMNLSDLFVESASLEESPLLPLLAAALQRYVDYDFVVIPVGIGCHIDHLMARTAAEQVWQPMQRQYYLDMPYALDPRRWRLRDLTYLWAYKLWLGWPTPLKHESLRCYQTQIQYLMPPIEWFPEVILTQTNGIV